MLLSNAKPYPHSQVVESLVKTCSILLEDRNLESWREMGNDKKKRKALTKLTRVLENAGLLLPEGARENEEVTITAKNTCKLPTNTVAFFIPFCEMENGGA